jgi:hypothetical protein
MKKFILFIAIALLSFNSYGQDGPSLSKGSWLLEANTGFGGGNAGVAHSAQTGIGFLSADGTSFFSVGGEAGVFISDNLALKIGLGINGSKFDDEDAVTAFTYKLGAKYYAGGQFPLQIDITGASSEDVYGEENPLWLGLQGGYAIFLSDSVSIEPGLRYNISLNEDFSDVGVFELRVGFVVHL